MQTNEKRDPQALWVKCPSCGRDIDVPPSRVLSFLEYKLTGRFERAPRVDSQGERTMLNRNHAERP